MSVSVVPMRGSTTAPAASIAARRAAVVGSPPAVKRAPLTSVPESSAAWHTSTAELASVQTCGVLPRASSADSQRTIGLGSANGANVGPGSATPAMALPKRSATAPSR